MPPLGLPKLSCEPVGVWPFFLGTLRDYSGYGNHATSFVAPYWTQRGHTDRVICKTTTLLTAADSDSLDLVNGTIYIHGHIERQFAQQAFLRKLGTGVQYRLYSSNGANIALYDGTAASSVNVSLVGATSVAAAWNGGGLPEFFVSGSSIGSGANAVTTSGTDQVLTILGNGAVGSDTSAVFIAIYPGKLSAPEIAQLHTWSQSLITPRKQWPGGGLRYPDRGDPYTPATGDPMYLDNLQTALVTLANQTSGQLSNTGLDIASGTFALREDATGRYIYCVGAGSLRRHLLGADTYTTALLTAAGATITKDTTGFDLDFDTGDILRAVQLTAP